MGIAGRADPTVFLKIVDFHAWKGTGITELIKCWSELVKEKEWMHPLPL